MVTSVVPLRQGRGRLGDTPTRIIVSLVREQVNRCIVQGSRRYLAPPEWNNLPAAENNPLVKESA